MKNLIVILGPTGIGKTDLSIEIAKNFNTEIISSDSRQIYKELKIGTAPPSKEQLNAVKHHFIANKSIHDYFNASMYEFDVIDLLSELFKEKDFVLLVGGSGMYIDAVCYGIDELPTIDDEIRSNLLKQYETEGIASLRFTLKRLDPKHYKTVDLNNHKRILKALEVSIQTGKPYSSFLTNKKKKRNFNIIKIGLNKDRDELHETINNRVDKMIEQGLINEAKSFYKSKGVNALKTVGYKELFDYFAGEIDLQTAIELIKRNTRRYARRQLTWFRKYEKIEWFEPSERNKIIEYIFTM